MALRNKSLMKKAGKMLTRAGKQVNLEKAAQKVARVLTVKMPKSAASAGYVAGKLQRRAYKAARKAGKAASRMAGLA